MHILDVYEKIAAAEVEITGGKALDADTSLKANAKIWRRQNELYR